jgi:hypothetical protein
MQSKKGSYTLEAVIVMSTIIFIIFAIVSAFLLLYQNAVMYYVATQAAQEGAIMWVDTSHNLDGTSSGSDDQGYYWRIGELFGGGGSEEKKETIKSWAEKKMKELSPGTMIGNGAETVQVTFNDYLVTRSLEVMITKEIDIPFKQIAQYFDADLDMTVTAKANIAEPAEGIRDIDYAMQLAKEGWTKVSKHLSTLLNKKKS